MWDQPLYESNKTFNLDDCSDFSEWKLWQFEVLSLHMARLTAYLEKLTLPTPLPATRRAGKNASGTVYHSRSAGYSNIRAVNFMKRRIIKSSSLSMNIQAVSTDAAPLAKWRAV